MKKRNFTDKEKERIALRGLADLFGRDATEIATDPRYTKPEGAPLAIVGELQRNARALRRETKR